MYGGAEVLFGQTVVFKRSSVLSLQSRVPLVLFPRHPLHTGKYRVTLLPLRFLCATRQSTGLWFAAKKTADSGLVCCPSCHGQPPFIGSRAHCLFSLHCWERRMGGTLVLPVSGVHVKETFPSAHSELASAPLAKTSQLKDAGFQQKPPTPPLLLLLQQPSENYESMMVVNEGQNIHPGLWTFIEQEHPTELNY